MSDRQKLLRRVQECDFVLNETALFLDTHPTDAAALANYKQHLEKRNEAAARYIKKYGPLSQSDFDGAWTWVSDPWPWDNSMEV